MIMDDDKIKDVAQQVYDENNTSNQFAVSQTPYHTHNGADSQKLQFIKGLSDVPNSYYQKAGAVATVNNTETGLEFDFISFPTTAPGGNNTDIQFNDNGSFGGSDNFTFDSSTSTVHLNDSNLQFLNIAFAIDGFNDNVDLTVAQNIQGYLRLFGGEQGLLIYDGNSKSSSLQLYSTLAVLQSAAAVTISGAGHAGAVNITSGSGISGNDVGANGLFQAGNAQGVGIGGGINIRAGTSPSGTGGGVSIVTGVGGGLNGTFSLTNSNFQGDANRVFGNFNTTTSTLTAVPDAFFPVTHSGGYIHARVVGHRTGGTSGNTDDSFAAELIVGVKRGTGAPTLQTAVQYVYFFGDDPVANATFAIAGNGVVLQVAGGATANYTWNYELWHMNVS